MKIQIVVEQEDIDKGIQGSESKCPIANALRRLFPKAFDISVRPYEDCQSIGDYWAASVYSSDNTFSFDLPREVASLANNYDSKNYMEPFGFEIEM